MKAMVVSRHGGPGVLEKRNWPEPVPGPGQVRVGVRAVGVNFADLLSRLGVYAAAPPPPFVPGIEVAGVVEALGSDVEGLGEGDRVAGYCRFGGYAQKVVTRAEFLMPIPDPVTFEEAACLPVQYLTAWYALYHLARLQEGERVLIHAAAGGTGRAAVELARHRQAHILATVGTAKKEEVVHEAAPDATLIHYRQEDLGRALEREVGDGGLDVILDSVGGRVFRAGWKHLAPGGRYVLFGAAAAVKPGALSRLGAMWRLLPMLAVNPLRMISKNRSLMAFNLLLLADTHLDLLRRGMREILALEVEGDIRPRIGRILSLWDAAEAHERLQSRETTGKLVLRVEEPDEASTSGVVGAPPPPDGGGRAG